MTLDETLAAIEAVESKAWKDPTEIGIRKAYRLLPSLLRLVRRQAEEIAEHRACDNGSGAEASYSISWERLLAATDLATAELVKAWEGRK